jgi:hypothetical protein
VDPEVLQLFVQEVDRQAQFGLSAAADLRHAVTRNDTDRIWYSIQSLLVATGNVSKLLWPSQRASSARGDTLRQTLQVENDSPLVSRAFRNHFEHFDERLEAWGISAHTHMVVDSNIGSLRIIRGGSTLVYVRNFDPSSETLTFHDEVYELRPIINALESLRSKTERVLKRNAGN